MEIIEPQAIPYSFHTLGWQLMLGLCIGVLLVLLGFAFRRWKKNKYRREGMQFIAQSKANQAVAEINRQMKITAIRLWGREQVAALQGEAWLQFLNSSMQNAYAQTELFASMAEACYHSTSDPSIEEAFKEFGIMWFKKHRK